MTLFFLSSIATFLLTPLYRRYALKKGLLDRPNHRSSHTVPTARGGGIIFVLVWIASSLFFLSNYPPLWDQNFLVLFLGAAAIAGVGYWDDLFPISSLLRGGLHLGISVLSIYFLGLPFYMGIFTFTLITLALAWSVNLYNFMDGTDGFAAVEALFIFGAGGLLLWLDGNGGLAKISWLLASSVSGFLLWNWPKAKIFMGDVGSGFLGFAVIFMAILGEHKGVPILLWLMLYAIFWVDTSFTLIRRMFAGEKWYTAHRSHAYQRLHQAGWSHQKILIGLISVNTLLVLFTFWTNAHRQFILLSTLGALLFVSLLYGLIEIQKPMGRSKFGVKVPQSKIAMGK